MLQTATDRQASAAWPNMNTNVVDSMMHHSFPRTNNYATASQGRADIRSLAHNVSHCGQEIPPSAPSSEMEQLVSAEELLSILWTENSRPSLRWLREQQSIRAIPFIKVGRRVWFKASEVRQYIAATWTVTCKYKICR